jgi:serine/threonine-protein kinase HipA
VAADRLIVLLSSEPVGVLTSSGDGRGTIEYLPEVVERSSDLPLLSLSLPVRREPYSAEETNPFLSGLLPEGAVRSALARRWRLAENDVFGLLTIAGRDCAGAVAFVPEEKVTAGEGESVRWLDESELEHLLDELPIRPLGDEPEQGIRISLAGAQEKLVVVLGQDGRVGLPRGDTPSTHILKPGPSLRTRGGRPAFPDLVVNEAFCLTLARRCGIEAATPALRRVGTEEVLVVERFDRRTEGGRVLRLHQEDVCQALGIDPQRKYQADGGPSAADVIRLLRTRSARAAQDVLAFIDRLVLAITIGNADAHAKNYSLLLDQGTVRLAPAYDLICTAVYPGISGTLAMAIGDQYQADQVTPRHWAQLLAECDLDTMALRRRMARLAETLTRDAGSVAQGLRDRGANREILDAIAATIQRRARPIIALPDWPRGGRSEPAAAPH